MSLSPLEPLDLPPVPDELHMGDVRAMLAERVEGQTYPARDLYRRYAQIARAAGRVPVVPLVLGRQLRAMGCHSVRRKMPGVRNKASHWRVCSATSPVQPRALRSSGPKCDRCDIPLGKSSLQHGRCFCCRAQSGVFSTS